MAVTTPSVTVTSTGPVGRGVGEADQADSFDAHAATVRAAPRTPPGTPGGVRTDRPMRAIHEETAPNGAAPSGPERP